MRELNLFVVASLLAGCAAQAPVPVSKSPVTNVSVAEVRADAGRFIGTQVRWGGEITYVENKAEVTWVEIVSRQLRRSGQPRETGESGGRFIASFQGFADPVVYRVGQPLTVLGKIKELIQRPIGDHDYSFPVVEVTASVLWPIESESPQYNYPPPWWYYDPWPYSPWPYPHYYW